MDYKEEFSINSLFKKLKITEKKQERHEGRNKLITIYCRENGEILGYNELIDIFFEKFKDDKKNIKGFFETFMTFLDLMYCKLEKEESKRFAVLDKLFYKIKETGMKGKFIEDNINIFIKFYKPNKQKENRNSAVLQKIFNFSPEYFKNKERFIKLCRGFEINFDNHFEITKVGKKPTLSLKKEQQISNEIIKFNVENQSFEPVFSQNLIFSKSLQLDEKSFEEKENVKSKSDEKSFEEREKERKGKKSSKDFEKK